MIYVHNFYKDKYIDQHYPFLIIGLISCIGYGFYFFGVSRKDIVTFHPIFMTSLFVSDLLVLFGHALPSLMAAKLKEWPFGDMGCQVNYYTTRWKNLVQDIFTSFTFAWQENHFYYPYRCLWRAKLYTSLCYFMKLTKYNCSGMLSLAFWLAWQVLEAPLQLHVMLEIEKIEIEVI